MRNLIFRGVDEKGETQPLRFKRKKQAQPRTRATKRAWGHPSTNYYFVSVVGSDATYELVVGAQGVAFYTVLGAPFVGHLAADFP